MKRKLNRTIKKNLSIITKRILIIFIIFTLFFTISSMVLSLSSPWPMFRHDPQHTGRSPYKGTDIDIFKWKFETGAEVYSSPAIGSDGTIYVGSYDYNLYAINPNGTLKWKFGTGSRSSSSPAIGSDGTIYVGKGDNLYAINPNGTLKWKVGIGGDVKSSPAIGSDGTIYVGSSYYFYAINPNGTLKWKVGIEGGVRSSPAIGSDGTIYIGQIFDNLYAINPNGTLKKWELGRGAMFESTPAIGSDGTIYVITSDYLYAINPNGTLKWEFLRGTNRTGSTPAIGSDGTIYVGKGDNLYAINPNGTLKGRFETGGKVYSSPAIGSDGTIYVGSGDGNLYAIGGTYSSPQISETAYFLKGSLHCPDTRGYPCDSCSTASGYVNHFKGFNVLTTDEDCYVNLTYNQGDYIGNQNNCEVTIKGEKWLELENESGTKLVEEINSGRFDFQPANKFVERTMTIPGDNYQYEFANEGKEFRLYLSRDRKEAFKAVPWQNMVIEIKNKETNNIFKYKFEKGIFPLAYSWNSGGMANYGQCVWWAAKRWVEEVDSKTLFPFYPPSPQAVNVKTIDSNYQPKRFDILIDYKPGELGHYGFVEKVEGDQIYITQFNWMKPGEVYNHISRPWKGKVIELYYSNNPNDEYYFKYYYRRMSTVEENGTYSLRDIGPAGGIVFYDKGNYSDGWRYLEAAPVSTEWTGKQWGSYGTLIGATGTGIGTGQNNTTKIATWLNSHSETDCAAQLCDALVVENNGVTYSDWFLPSKDELNLIYTNLKIYGVGGFADNNLDWSSSEYNAGYAWNQDFYNGTQNSNNELYNLRVRAVRAF